MNKTACNSFVHHFSLTHFLMHNQLSEDETNVVILFFWYKRLHYHNPRSQLQPIRMAAAAAAATPLHISQPTISTCSIRADVDLNPTTTTTTTTEKKKKISSRPSSLQTPPQEFSKRKLNLLHQEEEEEAKLTKKHSRRSRDMSR